MPCISKHPSLHRACQSTSLRHLATLFDPLPTPVSVAFTSLSLLSPANRIPPRETIPCRASSFLPFRILQSKHLLLLFSTFSRTTFTPLLVTCRPLFFRSLLRLSHDPRTRQSDYYSKTRSPPLSLRLLCSPLPSHSRQSNENIHQTITLHPHSI